MENLVRLYSLLGAGKPGRRPKLASDVLRSAVVLLHAAFEEFLRELARQGLTHGTEEALNDIPLLGEGRRPKAFSLGRLAKFRAKTVDELLSESIDSHLDYESYNNPGEVKKLLEGVRIDVADLECNWDSVGRMMARRHQIVHQADKNPEHGSWGKPRTQTLSQATVASWVETVAHLVHEIGKASAVLQLPKTST